jgi:hypothetical protein
MSKIFLNMFGVYHYRNRWALGRIKGVLNTSARTFEVLGRKKGIKRIQNSSDVKEFIGDYVLADFIPLETFLKERICFGRLPEFLSPVYAARSARLIAKNPKYWSLSSLGLTAGEESKYLARLIKNVSGIKEMWVESHSIVENITRNRKS